MKKTSKIILLLAVVVVTVGIYFGYQHYKNNQSEDAMDRLLREQNRWAKTLLAAASKKIEGWEDWYGNKDITEGGMEAARSAALFQISYHMPELIPPGYKAVLDYNTNRFNLEKV